MAFRSTPRRVREVMGPRRAMVRLRWRPVSVVKGSWGQMTMVGGGGGVVVVFACE